MSKSRSKSLLTKLFQVAIIGVPMFLIGCSQLPAIDTSTARLMTVKTFAGDTRESIARKYDARVVTFHPTTGQAVLALSSVRAARLSRDAFAVTDPNEDTLESQQTTTPDVVDPVPASTDHAAPLKVVSPVPTPEFEAQSAVNSDMAGWNTWSSGWSVYSSGLSSDLIASATSSLNAPSWKKILLPEALKLAPKAGAGVTVAVIDTGIDLNHPAFASRLVDSTQMWDFVDNDAVPQEVYIDSTSKGFGHGTCVAGIVAQIAPYAKIMPLRVLKPNGSGNSDSVVAAIDWAVAHGANVINMSLGSVYLKSLDAEIAWATSRGVIVVSSSGNTGTNKVTFPANGSKYPDVWGDLSVGVASTTLNDTKSSFSTYGNVEITAPGENVFVPAPNLKLARWSGTSMAAPMVAGGFALALGERSYSTYSLRLLGRAMGSGADGLVLKDLAYGLLLGNGRLNLQRFIQTALALPQ